jgi:hypothetical protein
MITKPEAQVAVSERRGMRRFDMHLPALIKLTGDRFQQFITETDNVSARGIFFYIDGAIAPNSGLEVTLTLPSQVALADAVRVRFTGRVVRVESGHASRSGVAALIEEYEFLRSPEIRAFNPDVQMEGPSVG